ncbi:uncharacterized protein L969DRAFT_46481 [Mixia osmundae IAM 14324]|uniref:Peptide-methionine (R)-S-oxide reductase n=1 Tax=Mixia osmundae (strain CBS 9802 / IAM 14324 / JCM 22182 / KY 12970) TaxID=764103 RepID=G7E5Y7_MIXOS|nr:uncharacterized protein L969DRAFT_46481 [Mixia osmundae IAM 14324]KEI40602.1 hypothetical protein L969DRAFT_46481 [Mixia osmundae IAM 14324]GAA98247.1 hypothetical protein E5Q_04930 [Mixia osmundae IAM 14324]
MLSRVARTASNSTRLTAYHPAGNIHRRAWLLAASAPIAIYASQRYFFNLGSSQSTSSSKMAPTDFPKGRTDEEWRTVLSPEQFRILRKKGTEMAGTSDLNDHQPTSGTYNCAACDSPLYTANQKFASHCGWPAFFDTVPGAVTRHEDRTFGMLRTEITCSQCGGHLGHVFKGEGYEAAKSTDERHCVNGISLKFSEDK